ncbi:alpha-lytic protease prodomain-containing protein [Actinomadura keratinilytica]
MRLSPPRPVETSTTHHRGHRPGRIRGADRPRRHRDRPAAPKTFSASALNQTADSVRSADIAGTAWYVDAESGKVVVTVDSTVSKAEIAEIKAEAAPTPPRSRSSRPPVSSPSSSRAARPSPPAGPAAPWASTCRTARAPSSR